MATSECAYSDAGDGASCRAKSPNIRRDTRAGVRMATAHLPDEGHGQVAPRPRQHAVGAHRLHLVREQQTEVHAAHLKTGRRDEQVLARATAEAHSRGAPS